MDDHSYEKLVAKKPLPDKANLSLFITAKGVVGPGAAQFNLRNLGLGAFASGVDALL
jgi:hypothetical protein